VTLYLDASALVSVIADEPSARRVFAALLASDGLPLISDFGRAEASAGLAKLIRTGRRSEQKVRSMYVRLDRWALDAAQPVGIHATDIADAGEMVRRHDLSLRAPDAIHIAAAHRLGATLLTLDRGMARAAAALGVSYLNPAETDAPGEPKD
jgi:uncharacterized protein